MGLEQFKSLGSFCAHEIPGIVVGYQEIDLAGNCLVDDCWGQGGGITKRMWVWAVVDDPPLIVVGFQDFRPHDLSK
jgi:hypothetical protein